jgi:hypothetical protein
MKYIRLLCTLLFGVAVLLFFGLAYPHHLHHQEQYQLFLFDSAYVWDVVKLPGGIADLLGRFCTQFFLYAWVGAAIIAVLLSAIQLLAVRSCFPKSGGQGSLGAIEGGLSFVPSFLLWLFLLDENALLGGVWAVLLTLLAAWAFHRLPSGWARRMLLIAAIPVLYWMVGPVCVVFFLLMAVGADGRNGDIAWCGGALVLLGAMVFLQQNYIPVAASKLWFGVHYHRFPTEVPVLLWVAVLSIIVLAICARVGHRWAVASRRKATAPSVVFQTVVFALVAVVMGSLVWKNANLKAEKVMRYDFMARFQQWNRILDAINTEKPNNQIGVTVQNLALGMHGMLADHLFNYNQNGLLGLLPDVGTDAISPLPTAEAFYQLGMVTVAQRTVFEAQEAILDFQKSARCYKRLAQTNLILGSYEVARKYLTALQQTLFYRDWANETLPLLGDEAAIAQHPEYGRLRQMAYKEDFYFGDHVTAEMLENLYHSNTDNRLAYQYLLAYYLLTGDIENYNQFISAKKKD